jgi:DNA mismatch repair protein MutS2
VSGVDEHSLRLLEFRRVTAAVADRAACEAARTALAEARPIADGAALADECERLAAAIRRVASPGEWVLTGSGSLSATIGTPDGYAASLDGPALALVLTWLEAGAGTRRAWADEATREREPALARVADGVPDLGPLRERLSAALEPDGRVKDTASRALKRLRDELAAGEKQLARQLERWAAGFGESAYVTRHGDRFVALVPAAGFPRRRAVVHDVSGSGQSLFVEPIEACEANNRLLEVRAAGQEEERRILLELARAVLDAGEALRVLEQTLAHLDGLRARALWAREFGGTAVTPGGATLKLVRARHPLLAMAERAGGRAVVPLDLELGQGSRVLLVSGPNMGGKTVVLKTAGLAVALSHAGFAVIADEGSAVPEIASVVVDLGDEQSVDQGLSSFAAHLKVLGRMAEAAGPRSLLLCDELGAGTDPEEGAALGRALVEHFAERGAWCIVTTHLGSLKRLAGQVPGVVNGSLEFDEVSMTSRYRFLPGIPGASHALAVAGRLGFPPDLLGRARELTPDESRALERLIAELNETQRTLREESESLAAARRQAEEAAAGHRAALEESRVTLGEQRQRITREGEVLLGRARELWQTVQREARREEKTRADAGRLREEIRALERDHDALRGAPEPEAEPVSPTAIAAGQRVRVIDLGVEAEVVSGPDAEGRVRLKRGSWNIESHASRLGAAPPQSGSTSGGAAVARPGATWSGSDEAPPLEVDLRGMESDEALVALDAGLDRAVLAGLTELRIVHGIGRGVLRAMVERHLRDHPQVASQRLGLVNEGGRGVTVARIR